LVNTPWFHTLGNHDHYGNAQAQIDYMSKSNRWILPNYNYSINVMTLNGKKKLISILMLDSIKLCGNTNFSIISTLFHTTNDGNTPSFASTTDANMARLYLKDLENQLKTISASGVPYIIVGSHFPIFSVAEHGSTQCLIDNLMPLLHKYKVSLYLSGHDHNLQHISHTYLGSTVEYMVTGANSLNAISAANIDTVPADSLKFRWPTKSKLDAFIGGFLMITASDQNMTVNFVKADGSFLYTKIILPRNK
jgi:tartrate-resistant acid phosphatase type 5